MRLIILYLLAFVVTLPANVHSQSYFLKKLSSDSPFNAGNGIAQLPDSNFVITGTSGGFDTESGQAYLMVLDSLGEFKWSKSYGGTGSDIGVRVFHLPGNGFLIAGYSNSTSNGDFDFVLYRTDLSGNLLWKRFYGNNDWEILHDAAILSDGSLILVGERDGLTTDGVDQYWVRTDANGDTLWTKTISTPQDDIAYAVDTLSASKFVVGGDMGDNGLTTGMIAKCDNNGTISWINKIKVGGEVTKVRAIGLFQNFIYPSGATKINNPDKFIIWYSKYKEDGTFVASWSDPQKLSSMFTAIGVRDFASFYMGYIVDDKDEDLYPNGNDSKIVRMGYTMYYHNASFNYSSNGEDRINQIIVTHDNGIAFVGTSSDFSEGNNTHLGSNIMVGKIGPGDEWTDVPDIYTDIASIPTENKMGFKLYPNPTSDKIHFSTSFIGANYTLTDMQGRIIMQGKINEPALSFYNIDSGIYLFTIFKDSNHWSSKIIIN